MDTLFFKKRIAWYKIFESVEVAKKQIPLNKAETIRVGNKKICIANTGQGLFAVSDRCPHQGGSLGQGYCTDDGTIVCPLHRYNFDLKTGRAKSGIGDFVYTYPLEIREDGLFIGIEERDWTLRLRSG